VRHRDLAHEEPPKARLPKNQSTTPRELTLRDGERPEKTIGEAFRVFPHTLGLHSFLIEVPAVFVNYPTASYA